MIGGPPRRNDSRPSRPFAARSKRVPVSETGVNWPLDLERRPAPTAVKLSRAAGNPHSEADADGNEAWTKLFGTT